MALDIFMDYVVGNTPMYQATSYCLSGNVFLKLEGKNKHGSTKERVAYYIIRDLIISGRLQPGISLVESTSGNLGLSLGLFARDLNIDFLCLIDPTVPPEKSEWLAAQHIRTYSVEIGGFATYRDARIAMAAELGSQPDWIWTRQYDNPSNVRAHFETTGPEIWSQMDGRIDYILCAVGSGGTVCGVGMYMKQQSPATSIVAIEPTGSTIFGGEPGDYLTAGAGMSSPSGIIKQHSHVIDYFCHVDDAAALQTCVQFHDAEGFYVGITAGSVLAVASFLANRYPDKRIVAVAADNGDNYISILTNVSANGGPPLGQTLYKYMPWKNNVDSAETGRDFS